MNIENQKPTDTLINNANPVITVVSSNDPKPIHKIDDKIKLHP